MQTALAVREVVSRLADVFCLCLRLFPVSPLSGWVCQMAIGGAAAALDRWLSGSPGLLRAQDARYFQGSSRCPFGDGGQGSLTPIRISRWSKLFSHAVREDGLCQAVDDRFSWVMSIP